jgi:hypothetical protein
MVMSVMPTVCMSVDFWLGRGVRICPNADVAARSSAPAKSAFFICSS